MSKSNLPQINVCQKSTPRTKSYATGTRLPEVPDKAPSHLRRITKRDHPSSKASGSEIRSSPPSHGKPLRQHNAPVPLPQIQASDKNPAERVIPVIDICMSKATITKATDHALKTIKPKRAHTSRDNENKVAAVTKKMETKPRRKPVPKVVAELAKGVGHVERDLATSIGTRTSTKDTTGSVDKSSLAKTASVEQANRQISLIKTGSVDTVSTSMAYTDTQQSLQTSRMQDSTERNCTTKPVNVTRPVYKKEGEKVSLKIRKGESNIGKIRMASTEARPTPQAVFSKERKLIPHYEQQPCNLSRLTLDYKTYVCRKSIDKAKARAEVAATKQAELEATLQETAQTFAKILAIEAEHDKWIKIAKYKKALQKRRYLRPELDMTVVTKVTSNSVTYNRKRDRVAKWVNNQQIQQTIGYAITDPDYVGKLPLGNSDDEDPEGTSPFVSYSQPFGTYTDQ